MPSPFSPGSYEDISLDDLLLFVVWTLEQEGVNFEWHDIVIKAFELFPMRFGLAHHETEYPDSSQVDRSLLRCRDKEMLLGKRGQRYSVTPSGFAIVEAVMKRVSGTALDKKNIAVAKVHKKSRAGKIVSHIKQSAAYKKFVDEEKRGTITEYDVCSMLFCTLDAMKETKRKNLHRYKQEAELGHWTEITAFLNWLEEHFPSLFQIQSKGHKGFYG